MMQQSQFRGTPMKDSNIHLSTFLEACDTLNRRHLTLIISLLIKEQGTGVASLITSEADRYIG